MSRKVTSNPISRNPIPSDQNLLSRRNRETPFFSTISCKGQMLKTEITPDDQQKFPRILCGVDLIFVNRKLMNNFLK